MRNKETYSHENYRSILKEARIWEGTNDSFFCTGCRRYVPKKEAGEPCIFCGSTHWNIKNPLIQNIINIDVLTIEQVHGDNFRDVRTNEPWIRTGYKEFRKL